ncbi:hypothetical protein J45TS6_31210 [Paenibacillus sp. J45TS6]|uniref:DUF4179 domain-containing protein n=1 Tax=Paenibacillus sp. J45TS6 TaxID=2807196 RepID=UPI001B1DAC4D|nr:DUF4179 domain-containing protein [Paenibacillus sp. J45TS6]GIP44662.1 hypothetical protein J45TS6_31210 [Paenibacillus sp. J45TS6]
MWNKEERILSDDAQEMKGNSEQVREMKLTNAVQRGIEQGKRRQKKRLFSYGGGAFITAIVVLFILSSIVQPNNGENALTGQPITQSVTSKSWSDSDLFVEAPGLTKALGNVLSNNLIQPVYQSTEKNGYQFEVLGAVTDGRKLYILYSLENKTDQVVDQVGKSFRYGNYEVSDTGASTDMALPGDSLIQPNATKNFIYTTNLSTSIYSNHEAIYEINVYTENQSQTSLEVAFELDPNMFESQTYSFDINKTMEMDGQKIHINKIVYTPLHTYVDLEYDLMNTKDIFQLINPVLIGKSGEKSEKLFYPKVLNSSNSGLFSKENQRTLVFYSSKLNHFDSIALNIQGISALEEEQKKIVIDLSKNEIVQAPDNDLQMIKSSEEADVGDVLFQREIENAVTLRSSSMWLDLQYQDADGVSHDQEPSGSMGGSGFSTSSKDDIGEDHYSYNFGADAVNYPQPLTIKIKRYWNPILEDLTLQLYSSSK